MAAQARSQAASPLTKQPVEADAEDDDAGRPAKKRRAPEQVSDRLSTTPVAADQAQSPEAGMNIDNYLDQEKPIDFTTSDFDIQPAPPPPPIVKPKATKPAFTGLKPSGPIKSKQLDEVDEQAYYYTVSWSLLMLSPVQTNQADPAMHHRDNTASPRRRSTKPGTATEFSSSKAELQSCTMARMDRCK